MAMITIPTKTEMKIKGRSSGDMRASLSIIPD